jgi:hypothetical protein
MLAILLFKFTMPTIKHGSNGIFVATPVRGYKHHTLLRNVVCQRDAPFEIRTAKPVYFQFTEIYRFCCGSLFHSIL